MFHPDRTLRVINIGDSQLESSALLHQLERLSHKVTIINIDSLEGLRYQIFNYNWNLVVSDYKTKILTSAEALECVKKTAPDLPFILVIDCVGEEVVADMMKAGVEDVVLKSRIERLYPVVKRILRENEIKEKEAKAQKIASEAFAAKEQMIAIVSHDIKNPLSAIQLEAQMLLRAAGRSGKSTLAEEVKIQANRILKTTDRMKILISDLLDKNKSEKGLSQVVKHHVQITKLVQDVIDALRPLVQEKEIIIRTSIPEDVSINLDRNKMFQVFCNLINNAIKFTPEGGTIQISMEESEYDYVFSVDDSGTGLNTEDLNKVFEKYWTGNSGESSGTGLGLFICKTIVEAHGGHIDVENIPESGARFRFSIPKGTSEQRTSPFSNSDNRKDVRKKIYIVDDDEDLREVISWALSKEGYAIHSFKSPREALDCLLKGKHLPNLIVVDFHMDEMKGSDFVMKQNEITPARSCPVIMISASPQEVEREVPHELYKEVITKPIDLEGLVSNVKRFLQ
jgi:signal transduction histidine kinase